MAHLSLPVFPLPPPGYLMARHLLVHGHLPPMAPLERVRPAARPALLPWVRVRFPGTPSHCHDVLVGSCSFFGAGILQCLKLLECWSLFSSVNLYWCSWGMWPCFETLWPVTRPRSFGPNDSPSETGCCCQVGSGESPILVRNIQCFKSNLHHWCHAYPSLLSASSSTNLTTPQENQPVLVLDGPLRRHAMATAACPNRPSSGGLRCQVYQCRSGGWETLSPVVPHVFSGIYGGFLELGYPKIDGV